MYVPPHLAGLSGEGELVACAWCVRVQGASYRFVQVRPRSLQVAPPLDSHSRVYGSPSVNPAALGNPQHGAGEHQVKLVESPVLAGQDSGPLGRGLYLPEQGSPLGGPHGLRDLRRQALHLLLQGRVFLLFERLRKGADGGYVLH